MVEMKSESTVILRLGLITHLTIWCFTLTVITRLAEFGADAVIKVREKKNKNFEGIVVLFD